MDQPIPVGTVQGIQARVDKDIYAEQDRLSMRITISEDKSRLVFGAGVIDIKCKDSKENELVIKADRVASISLKDCSKVVSKLINSLYLEEYRALKRGFVESNIADIGVLKYSPEYQLSFSLLVGNPNDGTVSWDISSVINGVRPFLSQFSNLTTFSVSSQIQNYAGLDKVPPKGTVDGKNAYIIHSKDLSIYINSAAWNLASLVSSSPAINFVLYIPSQANSPLRLVYNNGNINLIQGSPLDTNAFLIPQWGGVAIRNLNYSNHEHTLISSAELHSFLEIVIEQLRTLMGVKSTAILQQERYFDTFKVSIEGNPDLGITAWEMDRVLRRRTIQTMAETISTLNSLTSLLNALDTIPVEEHITALVDTSISALKNALECLSELNYNTAAQYGRLAIVNAEKAFFDPSMVSMLYFPAEHLLAIYMPFFVPIAVPMIAAAFKELKFWKRSRKVVKIE